jgi:dolichyl-phosphate beta-glucosyltransferase
MVLETIVNAFYLLVTFIVLALVITAIVARRLCSRRPHIIRSESERYFLDRVRGTKIRFPLSNYFEQNQISKVSLSVIVPAYNEEQRLPVMLDEAIAYLEKRCEQSPAHRKFTYEIIVVDDGSSDKTSQVALGYSDKYTTDKVRLMKLEKNRGKGGAVQLGVLASRGQLILFADADGATTFSEVQKLEAHLMDRDGNPLPCFNSMFAIGSRAHLEQEAIATRSKFRTLLMHGFHFVVWFAAVRTVRDTQCGFKLFPRDVALLLFSWTHIQRWAFDVELLHLAERLGLRIHEVCVQWTEVAGSKIVPVFSWLQMGRDVLSISFMYLIGAWGVPDETEVAKTLTQSFPVRSESKSAPK